MSGVRQSKATSRTHPGALPLQGLMSQSISRLYRPVLHAFAGHSATAPVPRVAIAPVPRVVTAPVPRVATAPVPKVATAPVGGNRSARRKPTTFGRVLTNSFRMSGALGSSNIEKVLKELITLRKFSLRI